MIVDTQSVKNTDSAVEKGYDAGKKVSGIKRHIAVDTQGLPNAIAVTTTDRKGVLLALGRVPLGFWKQGIYTAGYRPARNDI